MPGFQSEGRHMLGRWSGAAARRKGRGLEWHFVGVLGFLSVFCWGVFFVQAAGGGSASDVLNLPGNSRTETS